MSFYQLASSIKIFLGTIIIVLVYFYVNVYEDPVIGISLGLLGLFIMLWGLSFYLFLLTQKTFRKNQNLERITKDSYKLSLLFGIYAITNVLFLILGNRNKILGIILLIGFVILQIRLFADKKNSHEQKTY